uniref:C2H2-type domain-containing protein n=1 Tax=Caenorhabditis tropicalis TaxID=1561998 RepID=A0A1I7UGQ6_9PELO
MDEPRLHSDHRKAKQHVRGPDYEKEKNFFKCTMPIQGSATCDFVGTFSDMIGHSAAHWNCYMFICKTCTRQIFDYNCIFRHTNMHNEPCKGSPENMTPNVTDRNNFVDLWKVRNVYIKQCTRTDYLRHKEAKEQVGGRNVHKTPCYSESDDRPVVQPPWRGERSNGFNSRPTRRPFQRSPSPPQAVSSSSGTFSMSIMKPQQMPRNRSNVRYRSSSRATSIERPRETSSFSEIQRARNQFQVHGYGNVKVPLNTSRMSGLLSNPIPSLFSKPPPEAPPTPVTPVAAPVAPPPKKLSQRERILAQLAKYTKQAEEQNAKSVEQPRQKSPQPVPPPISSGFQGYGRERSRSRQRSRSRERPRERSRSRSISPGIVIKRPPRPYY